MIRILLLPLDERPCNYRYPQMITQDCEDIDLRMPPESLLGQKNCPADVDALIRWLLDNFGACDYAVISVDMLVYGGIVPSRLHYLTKQECLFRLSILEQLHALHPEVKIFAFSLIMRAPSYSLSEEEPPYYGLYGKDLYQLGVLKDRCSREICTTEDIAERTLLEQRLPTEVVSDFCQRRELNHEINLHAISLVKSGIINFLLIPMDDCAPFGWAAMERQVIQNEIRRSKLGGQVFSYSGADEAGCILTARAVNMGRGIVPSLYPYYSSVLGPGITPKFEDRPLGENLKWLIAAAGGRTAICPEQADYILMINAPTAGGTYMGDVNLPIEQLDSSYNNCRCLPDFAANLRATKKPVIVADLAFANGADDEWMELMKQEGLLPKLYAYAGWNTAANAAGTCISQGMICQGDLCKSRLFTTHRILEDWLYMSHIRKLAADYVTENNLIFDSSEQEAQIQAYVLQKIRTLAKSLSLPANVTIKGVTFPWHRLFEIDLQIAFKSL